ncbi:MAG: pyridoxal phosphate-dependent aminotransferase, partial [Spirochaetota bacterium]
SDESYYKMIYDGLSNISIIKNQDAADKVILIRSFTKTYAMPGWRVGYLIAEKKLKEELQKVLEWNNLYCNYFSQKIAAYIMRTASKWLKEVNGEFQRNRDILFSFIKSSLIFNAVEPKGNPFILLNVSKIKESCEDVSLLLLEKFGIPSVPGIYHMSNKHLRIAFGGEEEEIRLLVERLKEAEKYFIKLGKVKVS